MRMEVLVFTLVFPLMLADFGRKFMPNILVCDASPDFGFGVCAHDCNAEVAAPVGRLAERCGDFIRLYCQPGDPPEKDRIGVPHRLNLRQSDFITLIRSKARWNAHSSVLEAQALLSTFKWVARNAKRYHMRVITWLCSALYAKVGRQRLPCAGYCAQ